MSALRLNLTAELVIPSYNRISILRKTLQQIRTLYPDLPICLGLQGEMPDAAWRSELDRDPLVRVEKLPYPCTTKALNHCIRTSNADIILMLDDDANPHFGWLETHCEAFVNDPGLVYTSGRVIEFRRWRSSFSEWFRTMVEWCAGPFLPGDAKIKGRVIGWMNWIGLSFTNQHLPGTCRINSPREGNMGIRRVAFLAADGFQEAFVGNAWGFGADFGLRQARQGVYGRYLGDAIIVHHEVATGGTRAKPTKQWFRDFLHNQSLVIVNLGPQAWIGAFPRIIKYWMRFVMSR